MTRLLLLAAAAAAAVVLFLLLRPDGENESPEVNAAPATTATTTAATTESGTTTAAAAPKAKQKPKPQLATIRITIRGGRPVGGIRRATLRKNRRVRLIVRSDVRDHVHLHGYDIFRDVRPGAPAQIVFTATIPGRFEVELEDRGLQIVDLEVRP
jgi:hypothetical protein